MAGDGESCVRNWKPEPKVDMVVLGEKKVRSGRVEMGWLFLGGRIGEGNAGIEEVVKAVV